MRPLISAASLLLLSLYAHADPGASAQKEALKEISDFAKDLCATVKQAGKTEQWRVSEGAHAQVKGLVKKIADLGFEEAATISKNSYEGVLQSDLASILKSEAECRYKVFEKLQDKLISPANKKSSAYLPDLPDLHIGMTRDEFIASVPGRKIDWSLDSENQLQASYDTVIFEKSMRAQHSFVNDRIVKAKYFFTPRVDVAAKATIDSATGTWAAPAWPTSNESLAMTVQCASVETLLEKLLATFGAPVEPPTRVHPMFLAQVLKGEPCMRPGTVCTKNVDYDTSVSAKFRITKEITATAYVSAWYWAYLRDQGAAGARYVGRMGCDFELAFAP